MVSGSPDLMAAVLEHGAVGCRQGGYLAEYFVHTVPVDGVVDMLERVNIRATQGKWCLGTIDVRPGEPWAPLEPVVFGGAAETCDAVIGETGRRQGVFVHADPEPFGFDAAAADPCSCTRMLHHLVESAAHHR